MFDYNIVGDFKISFLYNGGECPLAMHIDERLLRVGYVPHSNMFGCLINFENLIFGLVILGIYLDTDTSIYYALATDDNHNIYWINFGECL